MPSTHDSVSLAESPKKPSNAHTKAWLGSSPLRIVIVFATFGLCWIWFTDRALFWLGLDGELGFWMSGLKGTIFLLLSGMLIYWSARREFRALSASNSLLRAVTQGSTDAVYVKDLDGRYLLVNEAAADFVGRSKANILGRTDEELFDGIDAVRIMERDRRVAKSGVTETIEIKIRAAGVTRTYLSTKMPFRDDTGKVIGLVGISRDITQSKHAEAALRESEERFRSVAEGVADPLFVHDALGKILFVNPSAERALGYTEQELLSMHVFELDREFNREKAVELWKAQAEKPLEPMTFETRHSRKDGTSFPVEIRLGMIRSHGKWVYLATVRDLSERKRIERQLRNQELLIREAAEMAHLGGWGFDPVTLEGDWTPEVAVIHDLEPTARANVAEGINFFVPEDRPKIEAAVREAITSGKPYDLELQIETALGNRKWVRTTCQPIVEDGQIVRVRGTMQDVTARKLLEEQFRQAQKMEAVGRLAGGIAHDFNNLLTVINGYCEMILADLPSNDRIRPLIVEVFEAGERAASLTNQLLAFSRKAVIAPSILDLKESISNSEKMLRRLIGEDIILSVFGDEKPCRIVADPHQIDQVILNLAVNSRDAMPQGGRLDISIKTTLIAWPLNTILGAMQPGRYVEMAVTDSGCGMSKSVLAKIFEPFFTTKSAGSGTGLGLAVVHGIVQQAGGHITVESAPGHGTTFRLYFEEVIESEKQSFADTSPGSSRGTETILLVEDEEAVRTLSRLALESQGYKVVTAGDGKEAMESIDRMNELPRILVTDVVMPEMSGRELAESIKKRIPDMKVLYLSGYTNDAVLRFGVEESKDTLLQKPFSPMGLTRKVRSVLDGVA